MDVVDTQYFDQLLQLGATYKILGFGCEKTPSWEQKLQNDTSLIFGRYLQAHNIPNDNFPYHYFDFPAYNELEERANVRDATTSVASEQSVGFPLLETPPHNVKPIEP
ncbi:hypothetical protein Tco_0552032 [Tanacetum coccineum]